MTRTRYRICETSQPHFVTSTIVGWMPVFTRPESVQILFDSWRFLQVNRGLVVFGYVILENHLHMIAYADQLAKVLAEFKSFTARKIIDLFEAKNIQMLLRQFKYLKARHKTDREYQVWQEGSHPQAILNDEMMRQKLEYIHNNPVERGYVDEPTHWRYSSARNYAGQRGLFEVTTDW